MLFNSPAYILLFLPLVFAGFFMIGRAGWERASRVWLVLASLFFYGYWEIRYVPLIVTSIVFNYCCGRVIQHLRSSMSQGAGTGAGRRVALLTGLLFNLGLLGYFKYADFFVENVNLALGTQWSLLGLVLPLAISFFTFQQIAYLVDCHRGAVKEYSFLSYSLFVTFFPQLIAGPIVHHNEMMPQFADIERRRIDWRNVSSGIFIFALGLFKKVFVADRFGVWANAGFDASFALTFFDAWATVLSFSLQIYFDFSGYTDMAIGAALLFNVRLPINFNSPYKSLGIAEFWQRWHMTLSRWLRDYVFFPIGGGTRRPHLNLFLTFLIGGLWHGAGWTFVIWGAIHGTAMVCQRLWQQSGRTMPRFAAWALTFVVISFTQAIFRATNLESVLSVWGGMVGANGVAFSSSFAAKGAAWLPEVIDASQFATSLETAGYLIVFWAVALAAPNSVQMMGFVRDPTPLRFVPDFRYALVTGIILGVGLVTLFSAYQPSEFLYFNF